jgi:hypothetical protein
VLVSYNINCVCNSIIHKYIKPSRFLEYFFWFRLTFNSIEKLSIFMILLDLIYVKTKNPLVMSGFRGTSSPDASGEPGTYGLIIF